MSTTYTLETIKRVYQDHYGSYIELAEDPDIPGLFMIRQMDEGARETGRVSCVSATELRLLALAIKGILSPDGTGESITEN